MRLTPHTTCMGSWVASHTPHLQTNCVATCIMTIYYRQHLCTTMTLIAYPLCLSLIATDVLPHNPSPTPHLSQHYLFFNLNPNYAYVRLYVSRNNRAKR